MDWPSCPHSHFSCILLPCKTSATSMCCLSQGKTGVHLLNRTIIVLIGSRESPNYGSNGLKSTIRSKAKVIWLLNWEIVTVTMLTYHVHINKLAQFLFVGNRKCMWGHGNAHIIQTCWHHPQRLLLHDCVRCYQMRFIPGFPILKKEQEEHIS